MSKEIEGDALRLFQASKSRMPQDNLFNPGEHWWLGDAGMRRACQKAGLSSNEFRKIKRKAGDESFRYGELVALSGDFYRTADDLFDEQPAKIPWLWEDNDLSDLRDIFERELDWIANEGRAGDVGYPDEALALAWNAKSYVELALENGDHFGWHNLKTYCCWHHKAIDWAVKAKPGDYDSEELRRAVFYNAFADHFLTDAFAAGHIRVPRQEIRVWARKKGYSEKLAGALAKILHDQDGHIATFHSQGEPKLSAKEGLPVRSSLTKEWLTRCDGQLFIGVKDGGDLIEQPVAAVAASLSELFAAWRSNEVPGGVYAATRYVPFPRPGSETLVQKFAADRPSRDYDKLYDSVSWYMKIPLIGPGLEVAHIRNLFEELPAIMQSFRAAIASDADTDQTVKECLPPEYIEAFREIG